MRWRAWLLLVGVFIAHDGANWISAHTGIYPWAVFFMLQGGWTVVLAGCLAPYVLKEKPSLERSIALGAIVVAIVEGMQIPLCGLFVPDFALIPRGVNVCDHVTGLPVTPVTVCLEVFILAKIVGKWLRE